MGRSTLERTKVFQHLARREVPSAVTVEKCSPTQARADGGIPRLFSHGESVYLNAPATGKVSADWRRKIPVFRSRREQPLELRHLHACSQYHAFAYTFFSVSPRVIYSNLFPACLARDTRGISLSSSLVRACRLSTRLARMNYGASSGCSTRMIVNHHHAAELPRACVISVISVHVLRIILPAWRVNDSTRLTNENWANGTKLILRARPLPLQGANEILFLFRASFRCGYATRHARPTERRPNKN